MIQAYPVLSNKNFFMDQQEISADWYRSRDQQLKNTDPTTFFYTIFLSSHSVLFLFWFVRESKEGEK